MSTDYTRGDSPVYDGYRESWISQREEELQSRIDELEKEFENLEINHCPGCLPDGYCRNMPDGAVEKLRADRECWKERAEALEQDLINERMNCEIMTRRAEAYKRALDIYVGQTACFLCIHLPKPKYAAWNATICPNCGVDCWEPDICHEMIKTENVMALCTECALRAGMEKGGKQNG